MHTRKQHFGQPRRKAAAVALGLAFGYPAWAAAEDLPSLGEESHPWTTDVYYENHTARREIVGAVNDHVRVQSRRLSIPHRLRLEMPYQRRADEAGRPGDQDPHRSAPRNRVAVRSASAISV